MNKPQGLKARAFYINAGKADKTLKEYFTMPEQVMREGKLISIKENNNRVLRKG